MTVAERKARRCIEYAKACFALAFLITLPTPATQGAAVAIRWLT